LIGCFTGLRFSDFSRPSQQNITDGYTNIQQSKTGENVVIPIHNVVKEIIEKHNGLPPQFPFIKFNFYLKEICKSIPTINASVSKVMTKAGKKVTLSL
jgi:hypothetical protein